jgi:hypothetical protein
VVHVVGELGRAGAWALSIHLPTAEKQTDARRSLGSLSLRAAFRYYKYSSYLWQNSNSNSQTTMLSQSGVWCLCSILLLLTSLANASLFSPFLSVLEWSQETSSNETIHELPKRALDPTSCPTGYKNCAGIGAPGLCCANSAICSPDQAGHVACCPSGAVCTGSISSIITSGVIAPGGSVASTTAAASQPLTASVSSSRTTPTSGGGLIIASGLSASGTSPATTTIGSGSAATTGGGFIIVGTSTAATLGSGAERNLHTVCVPAFCFPCG